MARTSVRIELDFKGVGELLRSTEVQSMLHAKGQAVARAAAGKGVKVDDGSGAKSIPVTVEDRKGKRARVVVTTDHPAGLRVETKYRLLGGAMDAARNA